MNISPDQIIFYQKGFFVINATIFFTWLIMIAFLTIAFITKKLLTHTKKIGKLQNFFELLLLTVESQIKQMGNVDMKYAFPFIGTLFIFIICSNLLQMIPFFYSPTSSLSTTVALAIIVVVVGISYGIKKVGLGGYLKKYTKPTAVMLPINLIGDISSNAALAIRLYGNMMSGMIIGAIVSKIVFLAFGFPIFLSVLSFISSVIQAYIFSILSLVFMMSAEK